MMKDMDPELQAAFLPRALRSEEDGREGMEVVGKQLRELAGVRARHDWVTVRKGAAFPRQLST